MAECVLRPCCSRGNLPTRFAYKSPFAGALFPDPPNLAPGRCFYAAFGAIFRFEPVLQNIELQGPDRAEERYLAERVRLIEGLHYAFPETMRKTNYKRLEKLRDKVKTRLAGYLASPRRIPFNESGLFRRYPELDG